MCGIAGVMFEDAAEHEVDLMLASLSHRGPDEFGTYSDDGVCLGTARLSIIDLAHGQQPMRHRESGVVVVFNGEVFNYRELRAALIEEGVGFSTTSDTEVVLQLYLKHGLSFAEHLNGQFAIGIWDPLDRGWCWPATVSASARSSTSRAPLAWPSRRRSRPSSPAPASPAG